MVSNADLQPISWELPMLARVVGYGTGDGKGGSYLIYNLDYLVETLEQESWLSYMFVF